MNAKYITLRLNLDREPHRRAWQELQRRRLEEGYSYSDSIAHALMSAEAPEKVYETDVRDIVRSCAEKIAAKTEAILRLTLPAFFAGAAFGSGGTAVSPTDSLPRETEAGAAGKDTIPDEEIPWDYLGG